MHRPTPSDTGPTETDADLAVALRGGDLCAVGRLAERYGTQLRAWAVGILRDQHAAEDAAQDALLAVLRSAHTLDPTRPLRPWLRVVTVNCARARLKRRGRETLAGELPEPANNRNDLEAVDRAEAMALVRAATWELDPAARDAFRLCYLDGLTHAQIARRLRRSAGSVSGLIRRARADLRRQLAGATGEEVA